MMMSSGKEWCGRSSSDEQQSWHEIYTSRRSGMTVSTAVSRAAREMRTLDGGGNEGDVREGEGRAIIRRKRGARNKPIRSDYVITMWQRKCS